MKYTVAILMLVGLAANVEAASSMLEHHGKPKKDSVKPSAHDESAEESSNESGEDSEDSGASGEDAEKPAKKGLLQVEDEAEDDDEEDSEDDDEDDDEESDEESGEDDTAEKKKDKAAVQLEDDDVDHSGEFFKSTEHDKLGDGGYKRVTTPRFAADSDDIFMRSMIEQYSLEGKNKDGSPNGQFWMDEANTRAAAAEVLGTHKGLKGAALDTYLKTYFPRSWAHFDVNRSGKVEVVKMPQFMRFIASDQQMYLW